MNFLHKHLLLSAEIARLSGHKAPAFKLYRQAGEAAAANGYIYEEALAYERLGKFYLSDKQMALGLFYLTEACHAYAKWGAEGKVALLQLTYPDMLKDGTPFDLRRSEDGRWQNLAKGETVAPPLSSKDDFDACLVIQVSQLLSNERSLEKLLTKLMHIIIVNAGANRSFLLLCQPDQQLLVQGEICLDEGHVKLLEGAPLSQKQDKLCLAAVSYVERSGKTLLLNDAIGEGNFIENPYIIANNVLSVLCMPLMHQTKLIGILYLENTLNKGAFTAERQLILSLLSSQMAISIENSLLYSNLEAKIEERTKSLRLLQKQMAQKEKMASLGVLNAGIAHEIKNPLNSIINFSAFSTSQLKTFQSILEKERGGSFSQEHAQVLNAVLTLSSHLQSIVSLGKGIASIVNQLDRKI